MKVMTFKAKLGNMRKEAEWIVYPPSHGGSQGDMRLIQSDRRICQFSITTRKGMLSKAVNYSTFAHLSKFLGAVEIEVPQDVVDKAVMLQPRTGDQVGPGVTIG